MSATPDPDGFRLELSARPGSVTEARRRLLDWLAARRDVGTGVRGAVALAVSEAVANSAVHAYGDGAGPVLVSADLDGSRLRISVEDTGHGFVPSAEREGAGLGMRIIGRLADEVSLHSSPNGTQVRMGFDLASRREAPAPAPAPAQRRFASRPSGPMRAANGVSSGIA